MPVHPLVQQTSLALLHLWAPFLRAEEPHLCDELEELPHDLQENEVGHQNRYEELPCGFPTRYLAEVLCCNDGGRGP